MNECETLGCENRVAGSGQCDECRDATPGTPESPQKSGMEGGSRDANPGSETGESAAAAREAFADAVDFFHGQLDREISDHADEGEHPDRSTTARDYFREGRGWSNETIDAARLGYAPASDGALLEYLMRRGYDRDAILGTGLFTEGLRPLWQGRYVLPYFDADGQPVYAISRATGGEGGGAAGYDGHPADWIEGKYGKPAHTKEYARVEEPIFGLGSVVDGEPVLVTEGIADAITAHQAGYPCLSPVTTRIKHDDREQVATVLADHDVPRAYVVGDAERASSDLDEDDRLTLTQGGEGLRGALDTAAHLDRDGVDARVVELPRPGLDKVDLDDYLREWTDDDGLDPVLASAKPAREHPTYDPQNAAIDAATRDHPDPLGGDDTNDTSHSELFDLDIRDVTGFSWDDRGKNPLGHHGESEKYYILVKKHGVGYDHKYKVAYNALTHLLVEAGERDADDPNGRLSDKEILAAWRQAKDERHIPDDDPMPHRALRHVALDHGLCDRGDIEDGWKLPSEAYNAALAAVRAEYGLDPGRRPISGDGGAVESVSTLPLAQLDALDPNERRRAARKRGLSWPTTDELREHIRDRLVEAVENEEDVVLDVPTGAGKSFTAATLPWSDLDDVTDGAPVVQLSELCAARNDRVQDTRSVGGSGAKLLGRREACPVARGEHDPLTDEEREMGKEPPEQVITIDGWPASVWLDKQCDEKGVSFAAAHQHLDEHNAQRAFLPCCPPVDASPDAGRQLCPAVSQWRNVPRDDDGNPTHDVVHATHPFAHVPGLTRGSVVIVDELADFTVDLKQERIRKMVAALLDELGAPVSTFEAFVGLARMGYGGGRSDAARERDALATALFDHEPGRDWYLTHPDAHTLAPAIARALWYALGDDGPDANGRRQGKVPHEPPRLDANAHGDDGWNREWVSVVIDETNSVRRVRAAPDLSGAKCVIGLDAHPTPSLWQVNTKPGITVDPLLDADERRLWRRYERGLCVVQVGDADRPAGRNGRYFDEGGAEVFLKHLYEHYGDEFGTAIVPSAVESDVLRLMRKAGVDDDRLATMHYGEEKSRDDFAGESVGAVLGCIDAGDDYVLDTLAELDLDARPETKPCEKCNGEGCSDEHNCRDGVRRAQGRGFVGPDAETAIALVASVRENHVAQGAGRYARDADNPEDTAVVFARTAALPTGFADYQVAGVERVAGEKQRAVVETAQENIGATARELKHATDDRLADGETVSKRHVGQTLADLLNRGIIQRQQATGAFGADAWNAANVTDADLAGEADVVPEAITNSDVWSTSTWEFAVDDLLAPECESSEATGWGSLSPEAVDGFDPPPSAGD